MKYLWNVQNKIIRNGEKNIGYAEYFIEKDKRINNMEDVVNSLNIFFSILSVWPDLAKKINMTQKQQKGWILINARKCKK